MVKMINILEECSNAKTIGISGHVRPDGDCVGSCMGLYLYLKKELPEAEIDVLLEKPADIFSWIVKKVVLEQQRNILTLQRRRLISIIISAMQREAVS